MDWTSLSQIVTRLPLRVMVLFLMRYFKRHKFNSAQQVQSLKLIKALVPGSLLPTNQHAWNKLRQQTVDTPQPVSVPFCPHCQKICPSCLPQLTALRGVKKCTHPTCEDCGAKRLDFQGVNVVPGLRAFMKAYASVLVLDESALRKYRVTVNGRTHIKDWLGSLVAQSMDLRSLIPYLLNVDGVMIIKKLGSSHYFMFLEPAVAPRWVRILMGGGMSLVGAWKVATAGEFSARVMAVFFIRLMQAYVPLHLLYPNRQPASVVREEFPVGGGGGGVSIQDVVSAMNHDQQQCWTLPKAYQRPLRNIQFYAKATMMELFHWMVVQARFVLCGRIPPEHHKNLVDNLLVPLISCYGYGGECVLQEVLQSMPRLKIHRVGGSQPWHRLHLARPPPPGTSGPLGGGRGWRAHQHDAL